MVLLIACANVANLLLARSLVRRKEVAVRLALGASRTRLVRQLLTESFLLAFAGGAVGLVAAPWITWLLLRFQPTINLAQSTLGDSIDARVLPKKYDEAKGREFYRQLTERVRALPGVAAASTAELVPLSGSWMTMSVFIEGYTPRSDERMALSHNFVGPEYHQTIGIPLVLGRGFTEQDRKDAPGVVIINEAMVRRFFAGEDAIGKRLGLSTKGADLEIIGVARDGKHQKLTEEPAPYFYLPTLQQRYNAFMTLHVRATSSGLNLLPAVRREVQALDPTLPISNVRSLAEQLSDSLATARLATTLTGLFGMLALLLTSVGIYGVMAYTVTQRTHEIGIRMALGAQTGDVLKLVVGQGMLLTVIGVAIGLAGALAVTRVMASLLYGVSATDPVTFIGVAGLLTGVALLACYIPARRATRVDPGAALRYE